MPRVLRVVDFNLSPFREYVRPRLEQAFEPLVSAGELSIDFTGAVSDTPYVLRFFAVYDWGERERIGHWHMPTYGGVSGSVNIDALRRRNYCQDVDNAGSCEAVVRETPQELGQSIVFTAGHEAGHALGLVDGGADNEGHSGDPGNFMFVNRLHADFVPFLRDAQHSVRHRLGPEESFGQVAHRLGLRPPFATVDALLDFCGSDGRSNRDILAGGDPSLPHPGTEIWLPDVAARIAAMRALEIQPKRFTPQQFAVMRQCLQTGQAPTGLYTP